MSSETTVEQSSRTRAFVIAMMPDAIKQIHRQADAEYITASSWARRALMRALAEAEQQSGVQS